MSHVQFYRATKLQYATVHAAHCNFAWTRIDQSEFTAFSR